MEHQSLDTYHDEYKGSAAIPKSPVLGNNFMDFNGL
jgi:hypothetical protein